MSYTGARDHANRIFYDNRVMSDEPIDIDEFIASRGKEAEIRAIPDLPYLLLVRSSGTDTPFRIISAFVEESTADIVGNTLFSGRYEVKSREDWLAMCSTAVYTDHVLVGTLDTPTAFANMMPHTLRVCPVIHTSVMETSPNEQPDVDPEDSNNGG